MRKFLPLLLAAAFLVFGLGCAHHHKRHVAHHAPKPKVVVHVDAEHDDPNIVIVHKKPAPKRHCRKHRHHWHCR
ncbi:MAG: hypothetical protein CL910_00940 [Deltaproteobacteria bacterium]|nr:hypothetical protein [Deltaproteobacteria bacterium]